MAERKTDKDIMSMVLPRFTASGCTTSALSYKEMLQGDEKMKRGGNEHIFHYDLQFLEMVEDTWQDSCQKLTPGHWKHLCIYILLC